MITAIILLILALALVAAWLAYQFDKSPAGWEDEAGFHLGEKDGDK